MDMAEEQKLMHLLEQHEGCEQFAYKDSLGYYTISIGRCIDRRKGKGISKAESLYLLKNDIEACKHNLEKMTWYNALDDVRKCVLIELVFNMGMSGVLLFKKMISALKDKDFARAARELLDSKWATQVGKSRRDNIAYRMRHGDYPGK